MHIKVAVYIRKSGTREYEKASPRANYPGGAIFCLRYTQGGKRKFETLSVADYKQANIAAQQKSIALQLDAINPLKKKPASTPAPTPALQPKQHAQSNELMLDAAMDRYLENVAKKSSKTSTGYRYTLQQFYASTGNLVLSKVITQQLYDFVGYLRREGLSDRTIHNRVGEVVTFLRHFGIKDVTLRVKYVEQKVRAYRPDELEALFAAAGPEEWLMFQFFLCTGAREQEVMYAEWNDIDFIDGLFTVRAKASWTPKDYEEREIPLPDFLIAALKKRMLYEGQSHIPDTGRQAQRPHASCAEVPGEEGRTTR
jgi:integrase